MGDVALIIKPPNRSAESAINPQKIDDAPDAKEKAEGTIEAAPPPRGWLG